jgi:16S rRNA (uracil1498-N3)-methyltransferase
VPKGNRADWLAEKLSELGAARWQPIACDRSVVEPAGTSKYDRWRRIAVESAKQSKRAGVMEVDAIVPLADALRDAIDRGDRVVICDTSAAPTPLIALTRDEATATTAFVGPEGGWTDRERALFAETQIRAVTLGRTVLRIETAAVVAAAMLLG